MQFKSYLLQHENWLSDKITSITTGAGQWFSIPKWIEQLFKNPKSRTALDKLIEAFEDAGMNKHAQALTLSRQRNDSIQVNPIGGVMNKYLFKYDKVQLLFYPKEIGNKYSVWNKYVTFWEQFGNPVRALSHWKYEYSPTGESEEVEIFGIEIPYSLGKVRQNA